ncbi:uncharacterized protein Bfra_002689 [Botrytis fragariae]|uniref:C2H2-type domain-containing protein n=1 Tax=Botrytis fragariae TaxID=1964551 RepID=A0A8H6EL60_9HELO|nr:uncharacterized protein Bfra_002689 [Botrytis fragariae]KAF5876286.1 hypothetical protein Bfra_002689 [Botrytis fragariae]
MANLTPAHQKTPRYNCNKCSKIFTANHNLNIHTRMVHKDLERCPLCHSVVKNLVQHNTRYHANVSKGRRQCQYCFRWYIRICAHKCSRQSHRSSYVPIACALLRTAEDLEPLQVSSSRVSLNRLPSTPILCPQHLRSRSVSLLSLNNTDLTYQISSSKLPCNDVSSPSKWARLDFLMDMMVPLDPTKGSPDLISMYPHGINDTISISPTLLPCNKEFASTSSPQRTLDTDLPDYDIQVPSIESCDADHPSAEEPTITETGFQWMTWEEYMSCNFNTLEQWL